jgi:hypothetical protein
MRTANARCLTVTCDEFFELVETKVMPIDGAR